MDFLKTTARGLAVAWLSPAGLFFVTLLIGAWYYGPQMASRAMTALDGANGALNTINRKGGVLETVNGAARGIRLTSDGVGRIVWHEEFREPIRDHEEDTLFADVNGTMGSLHGSIDEFGVAIDSLHKLTDATTGTASQATADLNTLNDTFKKFPPLIDAYTKTGNDLDARLSDQNLAVIEYHLAAMSSSWDKTSSDFQTKFHAILFPPPCHKFGCVVKYAWPVLKEAPAFGEGTYWTRELITHAAP